MILSLLLPFVFAAVLSFLLVIALQMLPETQVFRKPPYLVSQGFLRCRANMFMRVALLAAAGATPTLVVTANTSASLWLLALIGVPLVISLAPGIEWQLRKDAKLAFCKPVGSTVATVHLRNPFQPFDLRTYQELLELVEVLPKSHGVTKLRLSSPMFYHPSGALRSFASLEKQLHKLGASLHHSPSSDSHVFGKLCIKIHATQHPEKLSQIDLQRWYQLDITLNDENISPK
ncbi:MAG: hypothetical protein ACRCT7_16970 [Shewanella sp.]